MSHGWTVPLTALAGTNAATMVWLSRGELHVTVIVKASFAFVPGGTMTPAEPDPIFISKPDEAYAHDLVPFTSGAGVWLVGRAYPGAGAASVVVRLALFRAEATLLQKTAQLPVAHPTAAGAAQPLALTGFGPLAKRPALGESQRVVAIPEQLDPERLQYAPPDQRLREIRGDEWLGLAGVRPELPSFATRLPGAVGKAWAYRRDRPGVAREVELRADSLQIDAERQRCSVVWRGQLALDSLVELALTHIVAGVQRAGGEDLPWRDPFEAERAAAPVAQPAAASGSGQLRRTMMHAAQPAAEDPLPFSGSAAPPQAAAAGQADQPFTGTVDLISSPFAGGPAQGGSAATPFETPEPSARQPGRRAAEPKSSGH